MAFLPKRITHSWLFDIIAVVTLIVVIFIISNVESLQQKILLPLLYNIEYFFANYDEIIRNYLDLGTILSILGGILVVAFIFWRVVWHLRSIDRFTSEECPRCGNQLIRVKRSAFQRTLGKIVPNRKFHCKKCRWQGIRLKPLEKDFDVEEDGE